jgi:predicted transcriptional regulator
MTDRHVDFHVGEGFDNVAKRVTDAWHKAEQGKDVHERHISFISWDLLASVMTNKRYELLKYVHSNPVKNIALLAREMHRDYKRVYEDVHILESAGLLSRENGMLYADYDRINSSIQL